MRQNFYLIYVQQSKFNFFFNLIILGHRGGGEAGSGEIFSDEEGMSAHKKVTLQIPPVPPPSPSLPHKNGRPLKIRREICSQRKGI